MKKWIWYVIGTVLVVGLAGGFFIHRSLNASTYKTSMQDGRTQIENKQYNAAQANFQKAAKIKPDSMEANNLLSQTSKFVDAENKFKDYDFSGASEGFKDVMSYNQGSSVLEKRAKVELKVLKQVSKNVTRLEKIYNQALAQNKAKKFEASNTTLQRIFDDDLASNTFYAGIVKEAKKLKAANDDHVVLSKYKAKKTNRSETSDKKSKKDKDKKKAKITKATKSTTNAINAVTSTVAPTVANNNSSTTTPSSANANKENTATKPAESNNSSNNNASAHTHSSANSNSSAGNSAPASSSSNNAQPAAPVEHHSSSANNNPAPAPEAKPESNSSSQGNAPSTPAVESQGNAPTTVTPSN